MSLSIKSMVFGFSLAAIFIIALYNQAEPDIFWHLKAGQVIAEIGIPKADPFSFTFLGRPWVAHEWLSEFLFYKIQKIAGMEGLTVFFALVGAAIFVLCMVATRLSDKIPVAIFSIVGMFGSRFLWGVRPQILGFLMFSALLAALSRPIAKWAIPAIMVAWVNLHGSFAIGFAVLAIAALYDRPLWKVFFVSALSVGILNPQGFWIFKYPFETLFSPSMKATILEWQSPNFHFLEYIPFLALAAIIAFVRKPFFWKRDAAILTVLFFAGMFSRRHIPFFVIAAVPACAVLVDQLRGSEEERRGRVSIILAAMLVFSGFCFSTWNIKDPLADNRNRMMKWMPIGAANYVLEKKIENVFNEYSFGGYLIWRGIRVYIDGRADLYGDKFMMEYLAIKEGRAPAKIIEKFLAEKKIGAVVMPPSAPVVHALLSGTAWKISYRDFNSIVLERGKADEGKKHDTVQLPKDANEIQKHASNR